MKSGSTVELSVYLCLSLSHSLSICGQLTNEKWRLKAFYACANFTFTVIANWRLMRLQQPRTAHSPLSRSLSISFPPSVSLSRLRFGQIMNVNVVGNGHLMFNFSQSPSLSLSLSRFVCLLAL